MGETKATYNWGAHLVDPPSTHRKWCFIVFYSIILEYFSTFTICLGVFGGSRYMDNHCVQGINIYNLIICIYNIIYYIYIYTFNQVYIYIHIWEHVDLNIKTMRSLSDLSFSFYYIYIYIYMYVLSLSLFLLYVYIYIYMYICTYVSSYIQGFF